MVNWLVVGISLVAAQGGFIYGLDSGIISTTFGHPSFNRYMYGPTMRNTSLQGAIVSVYNAGQAIGGLSVGYLADKLSRRWTISIAAAFTVLGCILQCAAQHVGMLIAGRAVAGIGCGQILSVVPIYLAEVAPPGQRGFLVGLQGTMISIGFAVSNWIGYACAFAPGNSSWRIALSMQLPVPILLMIELFYVPYSPRWLVQQDRYEEARKVLARLHPTTGDLFAEQELAQITLQIQLEREQGIATWTTSLRQMFSLRYVRRTLLAAFTVSMGQLSGGAVIQNFQVTFYANVGFRGRDALLISGVYGLMSVIGQAIYLWVVADRWPRTKTMIGGSAATSVMLGLCMALSAEYGSATNTNKDGARAAIAAIFLYSIVYSACFNAMVWVVPSELFPFFLRTKGLAFAVMCKSVIAIVLSQISPVALANISWKYFSLFIATNGAAALIYFFFLPETTGKTLEEIAALFGDEVATETTDNVEEKVREITHIEIASGTDKPGTDKPGNEKSRD